ncbi:pentapeptide repeat-containing protein [Anabaena sp. CCY 0017]|uniref:pentapeptide repeat-containing protein n=1 Tax=Anabaena sp. CCY 0017 TaxID=3103866 RepID=UPI0039C71ABB
MNDNLQEQWLEKWGKLVGQDKVEAFQKFLTADSCPKRVQELAREPLLLYLLAAMHRDDQLNTEMFKDSSGAQAKILIYQTTMDWVLTKQRPQELNDKITEFETEDLRFILIEAGLCVTQSGREWTSIKTIEERLKNDKSVKNILEKAQQNLGKNPLRNALAAFYLRPAKASDSTEGAVEFIHKSFGEFLCAQKITESLKKWVSLDPASRRDKFLIDDEQLSKEIYDLLSYGGLTSEIVEYLMTLLEAEENFQYIKLFERLEYFYLDWCQGKFISRHPNNLPLNQMQIFKEQGILLDLREVDIYAGLNVMILLLEVHRYAQAKNELKDQIIFYICGREDSDNFFDDQRLLRIISYSNSVILDTFSKTVGYFLLGVNLVGANLVGASLEGANLEGANLEGAFLEGANLVEAYLSDANLEGAYLNGAYLIGAYLNGANLVGANLNGANLEGTYLNGAYLEGAYLNGAYLEGAFLSSVNLEGTYLNGANLKNVIWDEYTNWNVRGLDSAVNVPDGLRS